MHSSDAYRVASAALRGSTELGYARLATTVGAPPVVQKVLRGGVELSVSVSSQWLDKPGGVIKVVAIVEGPSTWRLERQEESVVVHPDDHVPI